MQKPPVPKDWRKLVEKKLTKAAYSEADILEIIYTCQDFLSEIQPISQWIVQQEGFIRQLFSIFSQLYSTRFNKQPPPRPTEKPIPEVLLDTPEIRRQTIREVALSMAKLGEDVSDEAVLEELKRRGMKIDLVNPTATISTVLRGFKPQFEKVQGKRGVFRRQH